MPLSAFQKFFEMEEERAALQDAANMKMDALVRKLKEKEELLKDLKYELQQYEEIGFGRIVSFIHFYNRLIIVSIKSCK